MTDDTPTIPDPGLTLSETINTMGNIAHLADLKGPDAILESVWHKLQRSANEFAQTHPEEFKKVEAEIEMQKRLAGD